MQYKTIVLELLQQQPLLHERLRSDRQLLPTMNAYAAELRAKHLAWMETLRRSWPESHPSQIASEALELALEDLQQALQQQFPEDAEPFSLDNAMAFVRRHTPPA
jgi:hypothetical protein